MSDFHRLPAPTSKQNDLCQMCFLCNSTENFIRHTYLLKHIKKSLCLSIGLGRANESNDSCGSLVHEWHHEFRVWWNILDVKRIETATTKRTVKMWRIVKVMQKNTYLSSHFVATHSSDRKTFRRTFVIYFIVAFRLLCVFFFSFSALVFLSLAIVNIVPNEWKLKHKNARWTHKMPDKRGENVEWTTEQWRRCDNVLFHRTCNIFSLFCARGDDQIATSKRPTHDEWNRGEKIAALWT